jgi:hypothetical protein
MTETVTSFTVQYRETDGTWRFIRSLADHRKAVIFPDRPSADLMADFYVSMGLQTRIIDLSDLNSCLIGA